LTRSIFEAALMYFEGCWCETLTPKRILDVLARSPNGQAGRSRGLALEFESVVWTPENPEFGVPEWLHLMLKIGELGLEHGSI
jgi:hypothetical protein